MSSAVDVGLIASKVRRGSFTSANGAVFNGIYSAEGKTGFGQCAPPILQASTMGTHG